MKAHRRRAFVLALLLAACGGGGGGGSGSPWSFTGDPVEAWRNHRAVLLDDGRPLVVGGLSTSTQLYEPGDGEFSPGPALKAVHVDGFTMTKLLDGRVLITGSYGASATAEVYDPSSKGFVLVAPMGTARQYHAATLLADGRVIVTGGEDATFTPMASCEIYDPVGNSWTPAASMANVRSRHVAERLGSGSVVVAGNAAVGPPSLTSEVYVPGTNSWHPAGNLASEIQDGRSVVLGDGRVLLVGDFLPTAQLFDPGLEQWSESEALLPPRAAASA